MKPEVFEREVKRLQSNYGDHQYKIERTKLLWRTYQNEDDTIFTQAVDILIMQNRSAPMFKEFDDAINESRKAVTALRYTPIFRGGFNELLNEVQEKVTESRKDFVTMCLAHLNSFRNKKITREQFIEGCDHIDDLAQKLNPKQRGVVHGSSKHSTATGVAIVPNKYWER